MSFSFPIFAVSKLIKTGSIWEYRRGYTPAWNYVKMLTNVKNLVESKIFHTFVA